MTRWPRRRGAVALVLAAAGLLAGGCGGNGDGAAATDADEPFALQPVLEERDPPCGDGFAPEIREGETRACLRLGPAIVATDDVRSAALGRTLGGPSVSIVLGRAGAATLDDFAARSLGERLAIVVDGRVVRAPEVRNPSFVGRVEVVGLSDGEAEELLADLDAATGG